MSTFKLVEPRYEALRKELLDISKSSRGSCGYFTRIFSERFPELKRVAGFYYAPGGVHSHGEHWWLTDAAGNIVDPTADQFPSQGTGVYVRYDPTRHITAKGTCPGCGSTLFAFARKPCSSDCDAELAAEWSCLRSSGPFEADMEFSCDAELAEKYGVVLEAVA